MKCPFCGGKMSRRFYQMECFDCGESPSDAAMSRIRELEARVQAKENLLRWRKVGEEMPDDFSSTNGRMVLTMDYTGVVRILPVWSLAPFSTSGVTHWRPIGPLPTEEPAAIARAKGGE